MPNAPATLHVMLPVPVGDGYDYLAPIEGILPRGTFVEVPFGRNKFVIGIVWGEGSGKVAQEKLKPIAQIINIPPLPKVTLEFIDWFAAYNVTPRGSVLKMVLGGRWKLLSEKDKLPEPLPYTTNQPQQLNAEQLSAAGQLVKNIANETFSVSLLDGVTGSGKTEVYAEAIDAALSKGKQVLILLPEISMTAALLNRLEKRFGEKPVEWHSELTEKQRRINWHAIAQNKIRFVIGARSALMLPFANLGLIVVDEEHEASFKQEEGVVYHGRDMAIVRAKLGQIPIILASATPSLETLQNARMGKYQHHILKFRFGEASMPDISLVDLCKEKLESQNFISAPLIKAIQETAQKGHQTLLFLNRRGYAPLTLCRACGHRMQCPNCSTWLIAHQKTKRLHCHHCDYSTYQPTKCPACNAEDKFAACGPGIERIQEEVRAKFPELKTAIMASDTLSGPKAAQNFVNLMNDQEIDVLIGTQIVAKGYHFPRLTFVGVIDSDLGLSGGDPRAAERTFQLLQQVSGRSGRAEDKGSVLLQTTQPNHPVLQALVKGDRDAFMEAELNERRNYSLPPFTRLAAIILAGPDLREVTHAAQRLANSIPHCEDVKMLGPAPAIFSQIRGKFRYRILLQSRRSFNLSAYITAWAKTIDLPHTYKLTIDIDPYNFL